MSPPRGKVPRMSDLPKESQIITRAPTSAIELWVRAARSCATRKRWPRPDRSLSRWVRETLIEAAERELGSRDLPSHLKGWRKMTPAERRAVALEHVEFLESMRIPELRDSGRNSTADDLQLCVEIIRGYRGGDL